MTSSSYRENTTQGNTLLRVPVSFKQGYWRSAWGESQEHRLKAKTFAALGTKLRKSLQAHGPDSLSCEIELDIQIQDVERLREIRGTLYWFTRNLLPYSSRFREKLKIVVADTSDSQELGTLQKSYGDNDPPVEIVLRLKHAAAYLGITSQALMNARRRGNLGAVFGPWVGRVDAVNPHDRSQQNPSWKHKKWPKVYFLKRDLDQYRKERWTSLQKRKGLYSSQNR